MDTARLSQSIRRSSPKLLNWFFEILLLELIGMNTSAVLVHAYAALQHVRQVALIREAQEMNDMCERRNLVGNIIGLEARSSADYEIASSDFLVPRLCACLRRSFDAVSCSSVLPRGTVTFAVLFLLLPRCLSFFQSGYVFCHDRARYKPSPPDEHNTRPGIDEIVGVLACFRHGS